MSMKGNKDVIVWLNKILKNELTAINQYFLHAKIVENWGIKKLGEHIQHESIDEMKHADALMERIIFLEGSPNVSALDPLNIGQDVSGIIRSDLGVEERAIPDLQQAIICCEEVKDFGSRELLEDILVSEEEHVDWLEDQLELIDRVGIENYTQTMI
jgi:bacterioferritin